MSKLTKIVIPVAGLGTRVLPASKAIPKEMLTVVDKPVIQHVVEEAVGAGFTEIILITRSSKQAIEDHFDVHYELETELERKGKDSILNDVKGILPAGVSISSVRQGRALGLGHAVLCAAPLVGNEPFAVMLPDMLIHNPSNGSQDLAAMVKDFNETGAAQIMVEAVPEEHVERYGVVDCDGKPLNAGQGQPIIGMVEKPPRDKAPSNQAIVGRYILPARVMELLKDTKPGAGNEIQLTDALDALIKEAPMRAYSMVGKTYDCGNKLGFVQANMAFAMSHPDLGEDFIAFIKEAIA
ncbi:UTP--glucose-1-phosphate uridylyltransferase GalU [Neptunomonas phycophila]|jgi:UTP--glucose-1-phosphate uridylyltransferase|uniref:UTP--glucose-1-phosphate uridylyltransferase n=2 Tax=Neptunomonas phycophila TaxID=1572645 RepID=A0AAW7XIT2_9GAMM|nr:MULTISPECIES: UTP--glucose-1-phosphate uridylyltransferase GalU [Neptunomonas]MDN2661060.1 UTP--glucose-1-phosphate uridylyltransferase GalU [Neptunomonas sp. CHC150]MDO6454331.1 UTP--glucose-1-phosphate uridylyltransferase GalU [Neptunomonas phycophila]MDP2522067.1 UTP--glucose-1-phosphate uridylyltransferase GalU [Neptunomonas phycophila]